MLSDILLGFLITLTCGQWSSSIRVFFDYRVKLASRMCHFINVTNVMECVFNCNTTVFLTFRTFDVLDPFLTLLFCGGITDVICAFLPLSLPQSYFNRVVSTFMSFQTYLTLTFISSLHTVLSSWRSQFFTRLLFTLLKILLFLFFGDTYPDTIKTERLTTHKRSYMMPLSCTPCIAVLVYKLEYTQ